jgi:1-deoxy-D-xylulose-5-phosphate reductoisomerase
MNAAHEVGLDGFISGQIGFLDMARLVEDTVATLDCSLQAGSLDDVFEADRTARMAARTWIETRGT